MACVSFCFSALASECLCFLNFNMMQTQYQDISNEIVELVKIILDGRNNVPLWGWVGGGGGGLSPRHLVNPVFGTGYSS